VRRKPPEWRGGILAIYTPSRRLLSKIDKELREKKKQQRIKKINY
jgi:hypothetical protein